MGQIHSRESPGGEWLVKRTVLQSGPWSEPLPPAPWTPALSLGPVLSPKMGTALAGWPQTWLRCDLQVKASTQDTIKSSNREQQRLNIIPIRQEQVCSG